MMQMVAPVMSALVSGDPAPQVQREITEDTDPDPVSDSEISGELQDLLANEENTETSISPSSITIEELNQDKPGDQLANEESTETSSSSPSITIEELNRDDDK